jgi:hypothetical protein
MEMKFRLPLIALAILASMAGLALETTAKTEAAEQHDITQDFRTADRCATCHNNLKTSKGEDVSIGREWGASIMANAARDPYWQGSVRREVLEHPESNAAIQNECASCHMPLQNLQDKAQGRQTEMFKLMPLTTEHAEGAAAADGVSCTVCHQIQASGLGTSTTNNGNFAVAGQDVHPRPVFGPYVADPDRVVKVHVISGGYAPVQAGHMRDAGLCGSCHTLYTVARGADGKQIGQLPEQMTYLEWEHSDYRDKQTCQQCHMPAVEGPVLVASLLGQPRDGVRRHTFTGANFLMEAMLGAHREELGVTAEPAELAAATARATTFLQTQSARVTVGPAELSGSEVAFAVHGRVQPNSAPAALRLQHHRRDEDVSPAAAAKTSSTSAWATPTGPRPNTSSTSWWRRR